MSRNLSSGASFRSIQDDEKKRLFDFLFWLTLFFIGGGLIFYIFVVNPVGDSYGDNQDFTSIGRQTSHRKSNQPIRKRKNWIKYSGVMETNANIQFKLNGYDGNAKYTFDFGDGTIKNCRSTKISHAFAKPGKYTVKVKVAYNNKVAEAWSETLVIKNGIPVDVAAFQ